MYSRTYATDRRAAVQPGMRVLRALNPDNPSGGIVKRNLAFAAAALFAAGCANDSTAPATTSMAYHPASRADVSSYLVDTGPGGVAGVPGVTTWSLISLGETGCTPQPGCLDSFQFLGGKFVLANDAAIDSVAGWMNTDKAGSIDIHIRADNAGLPGTDVYTQNYSLTVQGSGWQVFHGFTTTIPAGTYWLTFEPSAGSQYDGGMQDGAPNPLPYAFFANSNNRWVPFTTSMGMRVAGSYVVSSTPTDKINDLIGSITGFDLPSGTQTAANAKLRAALNAIAANNTLLACSSLQDEINFVNAQSGKKIAASDAASILVSVAAIRTQLGC
jgi:hypothetical protein